LPAITIENAGHANFFSNNTFHFYFIILSGVPIWGYLSVTIFYKNFSSASPFMKKV